MDVLPRATRRALDFLSKQAWLAKSDWYLAGGTALALQVGHRSSVDLDFFLPKGTYPTAALVERLKKYDWESSRIEEGTIYGKIMGAKASFIAYPYFVRATPLLRYGSVRVLQAADIAVMKIIAISQRGRKRDFVDLYWYTTNREPLEDIIRRLKKQYPSVAHDYGHIVTALTYFDDAEADPMPEMHFRASWEEIKRYFNREVPRVARRVLLHLG